MFRRRNPQPLWNRAREFLWPRRGWRRATLYIAHRLGRLPGPPYRIAAGFACGAAMSFTPFMGFHFLGAALLSLLVRGNLFASAIGTVVGNPWTFPLIIWPWTYMFGNWLLGVSGSGQLPDNPSMSYIFGDFWKVFWPMTVGGIPTAIVAWFAFFWPVRAIVTQYQHARYRRLRKKVMRRMKRETAPVQDGAEAGNEAESER